MVALKKLKGGANSESLEAKSDKLRMCASKYIVKYYDLVEDEKSLWVRLLLLINLSRL